MLWCAQSLHRRSLLCRFIVEFSFSPPEGVDAEFYAHLCAGFLYRRSLLKSIVYVHLCAGFLYRRSLLY